MNTESEAEATRVKAGLGISVEPKAGKVTSSKRGYLLVGRDRKVQLDELHLDRTDVVEVAEAVRSYEVVDLQEVLADVPSYQSRTLSDAVSLWVLGSDVARVRAQEVLKSTPEDAEGSGMEDATSHAQARRSVRLDAVRRRLVAARDDLKRDLEKQADAHQVRGKRRKHVRL